jgi:hypothetical protein
MFEKATLLLIWSLLVSLLVRLVVSDFNFLFCSLSSIDLSYVLLDLWETQKLYYTLDIKGSESTSHVFLKWTLLERFVNISIKSVDTSYSLLNQSILYILQLYYFFYIIFSMIEIVRNYFKSFH